MIAINHCGCGGFPWLRGWQGSIESQSFFDDSVYIRKFVTGLDGWNAVWVEAFLVYAADFVDEFLLELAALGTGERPDEKHQGVAGGVDASKEVVGALGSDINVVQSTNSLLGAVMLPQLRDER